jgi:hypothetical protein
MANKDVFRLVLPNKTVEARGGMVPRTGELVEWGGSWYRVEQVRWRPVPSGLVPEVVLESWEIPWRSKQGP